MTYRQGVPVFAPSGSGLIVDLKNIKISEIISWGAYKGEFVPLYKDIAGTEMKSHIDKDGNTKMHEVFKYVDINGYASQPDSDVYRFLEMLGVDEDGFEELSKAWNDNDLDEFQVRWDSQGSISEDAWIAWIDFIYDMLKNVTQITIGGKLMSYNINNYTLEESLPKYVSEWGINYNSTNNAHKVCFDPLHPIGDYIRTEEGSESPPVYSKVEANPTMLLNTMNISFFSGAADITPNFSDDFKDMIISFVLLEGAAAGFLNVTQESATSLNGDMREVLQNELFNVNFNKIYMAGLFSKYSVEGENEDGRTVYSAGTNVICGEGEGQSNFQFFLKYWSMAWKARDTQVIEDNLLLTNGLFMQIDKRWNLVLEIWEYGENRMTYKGMQQARYDDFGFYVSEFMEIHAKLEDQSFIKGFFVGLMKVFLEMIDAIVGFFMTLPIMKQMTEVILSGIVKVFGLTYNEAEGLLKSIARAIIIAIIIYFAPMLAGAAAGAWGGAAAGVLIGATSGLTLLPAISIAMSLYSAAASGIMEGSEEDQKEAERILNSQRDVTSEAERQAFLGTMGTMDTYNAANDMMYTDMFNPLDLLRPGELPEIPNQQKI